MWMVRRQYACRSGIDGVVMHITEILTPHQEVAWLPWAVQYFFLVGLAACSAIIAAFCALAPRGSSWARIEPAVTALLFVCAIAAPVSLLADLHQPGRFWHFYAHFTPWSWMSWGAVLMPFFVGLSFAFCVLWWLGWRGLQRLAGVALIVSALSILLYSGAEVMVLRSRILWHTYFIPLNFALTAWLGAVGGILVMEQLLPDTFGRLPRRPLLILSLLACLGLVTAAFAWAALGLSGAEPSFAYAYGLFLDYPVWRLSLAGSVAVGLVIIAMLWIWSVADRGVLFRVALGLMMLASAWMFRWVVLMSVQSVPKYGAGLYLYTMPLGPDGLLGMVGIFGLCAALIALTTAGLSILPRNPRLPPLASSCTK
ncbi:NrfD/PsrC family molybdoenzyme membrane anchor subunit [Pseudaminobacter salicylatoxidans]|uniref:NrfD/PsrC family molybdoenzyme membrane anchor subunit n=1 Tax=Pseudaminobacter salicylatoxidans TaxID=93369 RepID=UPI001AEBACA8|nr:NrfD/PsrC family molybdoenzyme membrane anchor subunit [Pseudaminobacter salicylatoxidans]